MELKVAKNLDEYLKIIDDVKSLNSVSWYRGMSNAYRSLTPSLFRERKVIGIDFSGYDINGTTYRKSDAIMKSDLAATEDFIEKYKKYYPEKAQDYNLVDYLYIMQHYDVPTRLLDFSEDPIVGLYFSVVKEVKSTHSTTDEEIEDFLQNDGYSDGGSSVHIIDPVYTNKHTNGFVNLKDDILNIDDINIDVLSRIDLPICINTKNQDPRIISQKGVFLLFGMDYRSFEEYYILKKKIVKIFIPNSCREQIRKELKEKLGITHTSIYPDIKGIALEMIEQIEEKYKHDCNSVFGSRP